MVRRSRKLTDNGHHSNDTEQNASHIGGNLHPLTESNLSVITSHAYDILSRSHKTFMHVQPHEYPMPWGGHLNYISEVQHTDVEILNEIDNLKLWTFSDGLEHYKVWKNVNTIPLAFDHVSYQPIKDDRFSKLDVCFVGGWADNGFNEKKRIMIDIFSRFTTQKFQF